MAGQWGEVRGSSKAPDKLFLLIDSDVWRHLDFQKVMEGGEKPTYLHIPAAIL